MMSVQRPQAMFTLKNLLAAAAEERNVYLGYRNLAACGTRRRNVCLKLRNLAMGNRTRWLPSRHQFLIQEGHNLKGIHQMNAKKFP